MSTQAMRDFVADVQTVAKATLKQNYEVQDSNNEFFAGFVYDRNNFGYYGSQIDEETYIIASFYRKTETINRNSNRYKESESSHVTVKFYIVSNFDYDQVSCEEAVTLARERTKDKNPLTTGYYKGYRLVDLETTTEDFYTEYILE